MTSGARVWSRPGEVAIGALLVAVALSVALVVGSPGVSGVPVAVIAATALAGAIIVSRFYAGYLVLVVGCFILLSVDVTPERGLNPFDLLLPFMLPVAIWGSVRSTAVADEREHETGHPHERIRVATAGFTKSVKIYYGLAALSLVQVAFRLGPQPLLVLAFAWARTIQGTLMFPLGMWWLRSERRIRQLIAATGVGGVFLLALLIGARIATGTTRPGMTWVLNDPENPTTDPNQAGLSTVMLLAFIFAGYASRMRIWKYVAVAGSLAILVLTQSRSGVLAFATFMILTGKRIRFHHLLMVLAGAALGLLLAPQDFRSRMLKTVTMHRGSTELYTWMIRVYGYIAMFRAFLDNWLFGTGFLAGGFVSSRYNSLGLTLPGADNYYLETAVGLGVIGLVALGYVFVRLFELGRVVRDVAPPGSLGHRLAQYHTPLIAAILVANLTGDNLVGVIANAQLGVWCAVLVRAGHLSLRSAPERPLAAPVPVADVPLAPIDARSPA